MSSKKRDLTTGKVAKICGVASRTVSKWVDSGALEGAYRLPGSDDRRIPREALIRFLRKNGAPLYDLIEPGVMVVSADQTLQSRTRSALNEEAAFYAEQRPFAAYAHLSSFPVSNVVVDTEIGIEIARQFVDEIAEIGDEITLHVIRSDQHRHEVFQNVKLYSWGNLDFDLLFGGFGELLLKPQVVAA